MSLRKGSVIAGGLLISGVLLAIALARGRPGEDVPPVIPDTARRAPAPVTPRPAVLAQSRTPAVDRIPPSATGEVLSAALNEERVVLSSSAVIEGIDADRPWVCTGERMTLSARVAGMPEPGAVPRWIWPGAETGAELHPGSRLPWSAPATPGRYFVRFQLCKDLGGRRVGVLAERVIGIDVRACGEGEGQDRALRIEVAQRGPSAFAFQAVSSHPATTYTWDFGDGSSAATTEPTTTHAYETPTPDLRVFTVHVSARGDGGERTATAFAQVRGQPSSDTPPQASLRLEQVTTRTSDEGWRSKVQVDVPEGGAVQWERVERLTVSWDDQVDVLTRPWREAITVEEDLERGGFRGHVSVRPSDVRPEVKQIIDFLHGRDAMGGEVSLSWSVFKAEPVRPSSSPAERPPAK